MLITLDATTADLKNKEPLAEKMASVCAAIIGAHDTLTAGQDIDGISAAMKTQIRAFDPQNFGMHIVSNKDHELFLWLYNNDDKTAQQLREKIEAKYCCQN